jgi:hypothetical protein
MVKILLRQYTRFRFLNIPIIKAIAQGASALNAMLPGQG